ncbi:MAG TPA: VOC family protein [Rhizobiaceae bacterium]|nr:VOC family protein [Rhizobiaceae bacterium]
MAQSFFWYELMTTDTKAAEAFYTEVVGWKAEAFPGAEMEYTVMNAGDRGVGGVMLIPDEVKAMGTPPMWLGYIYAADTDAATDAMKKAGGAVHQPPRDIPSVGRFSVVADPQGATFYIMTPSPQAPDQPPLDGMTPGHIGWNELMTTDWQKAFDFYASQFGWTKDQAVDMGPEYGTYQTVKTGGSAGVGMMNKPPHLPVAVWGFYFAVDGIDAAAERVKSAGGTITMGPMQVPGGQWTLNAIDPQGAHFGLVSNTQ